WVLPTEGDEHDLVQFPLRDSYTGALAAADVRGPWLLHYSLDWPEAMPGSPDPHRQLKFRDAPVDTVVTWCANHAERELGHLRGRIPPLSPAGRAGTLPGARFARAPTTGESHWPADGYYWQAKPGNSGME